MNNGSHTSITISTGTIIKIISILLLIGALFYLRDIVFGILTSIVIASAIEPLTRLLVRKRIPRVPAVVIIYAALMTIIAFFVYLILPYLMHELVGFMQILPQYITSLEVASTGSGSEFFGWQRAVQGISESGSVGNAVQQFIANLTNASSSLLNAISAVFGGAVSFVLIIVISFYFAVQENGVEEFLRLVTPLNKEEYVINLWRRTQRKIAWWIQGQFILAAIIGILVYIGLSILGVRNALFLALIAMVLELIPVFGSIIGAVPAVLVGFIQGGPSFALIIAIMYVIIQQIESNVIYPLVVKKILDIPPLVVIIALVIGARVGGFLGILLSAPVAVLVTEYMNDIGKRRTVDREKFSNNV
ncbi:MAG: AI-2E family transporter [bacterium]|nr:AI-2E family transporter [bacterium]